MWQKLRALTWKNSDDRIRNLLWATLFALFCGMVALVSPIDDTARNVRFLMRLHPADGKTVVIGIDEASVAALSRKWPWTHNYDAQIIDRLNELGARNIVFDRVMADEDTPENDAKLEAALKRAKGKVHFGVQGPYGTSSSERNELFPAQRFRPMVGTASINIWRNDIGQTAFAPLAIRAGGMDVPSISGKLAHAPQTVNQWFRPDFAIDLRTIPYFNVKSVLNGDVKKSDIAGKDVLIGIASIMIGDTHWLPGQGSAPGVYVHAIAAETLKRRIPIELGWMPLFLISLALTAAHVLATKTRVKWGTFALAIASLTLLPLLLDSQLISIDIGPGLALFAMASIRHAKAQFGQKRSMTNSVSGLPNLTALRLEKSGADVILIAAKMRNFSAVTASYAHDVEKALVTETVNRLRVGSNAQTIFQGDEGTFFWLAEKELLSALSDHLEGLHSLFNAPVALDGRNVDLDLGFGIDADTSRPLVSRIGSALLSAEEAVASGSKWKAYDPQRLIDADWRLSLMSRLDHAIENGEIWVAYQPKLDLKSQRIVGAEALARWTHPERGEISPIDFILAAEQQNRIARLTQFVLAQAINAGALIYKNRPDFGMAVNLSVPMLEQLDLVEMITGMLAERNLPNEFLTLEITESVVLQGGDNALNALNALRQCGINISIDDYGTGFSTLDYLKRIPANEVKIDKSFTFGICEQGQDRILVGSTVEMAHMLGYKVVAEGVETPQTLLALSEIGCDVAQGYLIGHPVPLDQFIQLLVGRRRQQFG